MSLRIANKWSVIVALLAIAVAMWILNYYTPIYVDDYWYPYMFVGDSFDINRPITSLKDILISQHYHYFGFNGRSIVHAIVQLFAGILGKQVFNIFNAIAFSIFIYLIVRLTLKINVANIIFGSTVVFLLYPQFNFTVLWMSGSVNYLWTSIIICLFIMLFEHLRTKDIQLKHFVWFVPGIIAGWTHEGIAFPLAISLIIYSFINYKTINRQAVFPLTIGFIIGASICTLSPATIGKVGIINRNMFISLFSAIKTGLRTSTDLKAFWILTGMLFILCLLKKKDFPVWFKKFYQDNIILWNMMFVSFGIICMSGTMGPRTGIGIELSAIVLWLRIIFLLDKHIVYAIKFVCLCMGGGLYSVVLYYSIPNYQEWEKLMWIIKNDKREIIPIVKNTYPSYMKQYLLNPFYAVGCNCYGRVNEYILKIYGSDSKIFFQQNIYRDILAKDDELSDIHKQGNLPFYVIPLSKNIDAEKIEPVFILNPIDYNSLPFYIKPFADRLDRYSATKVSANPSLCDVVNINNKKYLLIGRHEMIDNRVKNIILVPK